MNNILNSYIKGMGYYVPEQIIDNEYFTNFMDTSDQWIRERTGIEERRFVNNNDGPSDLAIPAVEMALKNANLCVDDIDFIIFATQATGSLSAGILLYTTSWQFLNFMCIPLLLIVIYVVYLTNSKEKQIVT